MMKCSAVFFVSFPKYLQIDDTDKNFLGFFLELSFVLTTQTTSKSGEDSSKANLEPKKTAAQPTKAT